jgi:hypothetical protein
LKNERSKQKTKCQKYFHNQKLRQKIRLKCENCTKGEYYFKQVVITGAYEQPFTYFSIPKRRGNDHKSNAGNRWGPNFPFSSRIDQVNTGKHKQTGSDNESSISSSLNYFTLFYFLNKIKFGNKLTVTKISSAPRLFGYHGVLVPLASLLKSNPIFVKKKGMFIHHVYFWLKNSGNKEDKAKLIEGLKKLSNVNTIKDFYIGQPAATRREVIDTSYDVSWLLFFDNAADQDSYQTDPVHLKFVEECSALWEKVVVYDSIDA